MGERITIAILPEQTPMTHIIVLSAKCNDVIRCQKTLRKAVQRAMREWTTYSSGQVASQQCGGSLNIRDLAKWRDKALDCLLQNAGVIEMRLHLIPVADWQMETALA